MSETRVSLSKESQPDIDDSSSSQTLSLTNPITFLDFQKLLKISLVQTYSQKLFLLRLINGLQRKCTRLRL